MPHTIKISKVVALVVTIQKIVKEFSLSLLKFIPTNGYLHVDDA